MKTVVLIDGGYVRAQKRTSDTPYTPDYVSRVAELAVAPEENPLRFLYYDCAPFRGRVRLPISGEFKQFESDDGWLKEIAARDLFAVRRGVLKFRGFAPKRFPAQSDEDFKPVFEQKGVDMRIGLDIAVYSDTRVVDRIVLLTQDTDCVPAMKYARRAGLQIVIGHLGTRQVPYELREHADFVRLVSLP